MSTDKVNGKRVDPVEGRRTEPAMDNQDATRSLPSAEEALELILAALLASVKNNIERGSRYSVFRGAD